ncbi:MAG: VanW family protein, partial [Myxococcota bacterium]
ADLGREDAAAVLDVPRGRLEGEGRGNAGGLGKVFRPRTYRELSQSGREGPAASYPLESSQLMIRIAASVALTTLSILVAPLAFWAGVQSSDAPVPGVTLAGHRVEGPLDVAIEDVAADELGRTIELRVGEERFHITAQALGAQVDVPATQRALLAVGRSGDASADLDALWQGWSDGVDVPLQWRTSETGVHTFVEALTSELRREPRPAAFDFDARIAVEHQDGRILREAAATSALLAALQTGASSVELPVDVVPATTRLPEGLRLDTEIASYETRYRGFGRYRSRSHNVELATQRLHGAIVAPGGVLSFNARVGERSREAGFRMAKVISGGELVDGMGGGVCQVASTLYAAALFAGMEMEEYQAHSRPSTYIPMGLDATVVWPVVDLQIRNPFPFPVAVYATAAEGELKVEILGAAAPRQVELERRVVSRAPFEDRIVEDPALAPGVREVTQEGVRGARVERVRIVREGDEVFADYDVVRYPPTDRIVRVGVTTAPAFVLQNGVYVPVDNPV